jgi:hypothetical protein
MSAEFAKFNPQNMFFNNASNQDDNDSENENDNDSENENENENENKNEFEYYETYPDHYVSSLKIIHKRFCKIITDGALWNQHHVNHGEDTDMTNLISTTLATCNYQKIVQLVEVLGLNIFGVDSYSRSGMNNGVVENSKFLTEFLNSIDTDEKLEVVKDLISNNSTNFTKLISASTFGDILCCYNGTTVQAKLIILLLDNLDKSIFTEKINKKIKYGKKIEAPCPCGRTNNTHEKYLYNLENNTDFLEYKYDCKKINLISSLLECDICFQKSKDAIEKITPQLYISNIENIFEKLIEIGIKPSKYSLFSALQNIGSCKIIKTLLSFPNQVDLDNEQSRVGFYEFMIKNRFAKTEHEIKTIKEIFELMLKNDFDIETTDENGYKFIQFVAWFGYESILDFSKLELSKRDLALFDKIKGKMVELENKGMIVYNYDSNSDYDSGSESDSGNDKKQKYRFSHKSLIYEGEEINYTDDLNTRIKYLLKGEKLVHPITQLLIKNRYEKSFDKIQLVSIELHKMLKSLSLKEQIQIKNSLSSEDVIHDKGMFGLDKIPLVSDFLNNIVNIEGENGSVCDSDYDSDDNE